MELLISIVSLLILILGIPIAIIKIRKEFYEGTIRKNKAKLISLDLLEKTNITESLEKEVDKKSKFNVTENDKSESKIKLIMRSVFIYLIISVFYFMYQTVYYLFDPNYRLSNENIIIFIYSTFAVLSTACALIYMDSLKRYYELYFKVLKIQYEFKIKEKSFLELKDDN